MADLSGDIAPMSRVAQLKENDQHWIWKGGLRAIMVVLDLIGIGSAAWLISVSTNSYVLEMWEVSGFSGINEASLAVLCIAMIWCVLCITVPFFLKPQRPIHPGAQVGVDLCFWLGFIILAIFGLGNCFGIADFGSGGIINDFNYNGQYNGQYTLYPNNTWIFEITDVYSGYGSQYWNSTAGTWEYPALNSSSVVRDCTPYFASCADEDAFVNAIWRQKPTREAVTILVDAILWLAVLLHFTLFVWACVDTHRLNRSKRFNTDQVVADRIIQDLERRGLIQVQNGQVLAVGAAPGNVYGHAPQSQPLLQPNQSEMRQTPEPGTIA